MFRRLFRFGLSLALTGALLWLVLSALASPGLGPVRHLGPDANGQAVDMTRSFTIMLVPVVTTGPGSTPTLDPRWRRQRPHVYRRARRPHSHPQEQDTALQALS